MNGFYISHRDLAKQLGVSHVAIGKKARMYKDFPQTENMVEAVLWWYKRPASNMTVQALQTLDRAKAYLKKHGAL